MTGTSSNPADGDQSVENEIVDRASNSANEPFDADNATPAGDPPTADAEGASSDPKDVKKPEPGSREELLAITRKALADTKKSVEPKAEGDGGDPSNPDGDQGKDAEGKATGDEKVDDELESRFSRSRRFRRMNSELKELRSFREESAPKIQRFEAINGFMQQHSLQPNEVAEGFAVMAALKAGDAEAAMKMLRPHLDVLQGMLGEVLPKELQDAVDMGEISERHARELARTRSAAQVANMRSESITQQQRQAEAARFTQSMQMAGDNWGIAKAKSDPEFAKLQPMVVDRARNILTEAVSRGMAPRNEAEAVQILERAYSDVLEYTKPLRAAQAKRPINPIMSGNRASSTVRQQPATMEEAARAGLAAARSGRGY